MELEKSAQETERAQPFQVQTAAPSQIQPTGERAPSAGGGKRGKTVTKIARKPEGIGIELKALACGESGVILKLEVMEGKDEMQKKLIDRYNAGTSCL